jgi:glycosyltransferase involved in cell wall biosynthesis
MRGIFLGIRPLLFFSLDYMSGGTRRVYELLKCAHKHNIDYVLVTTKKSLEDSAKFYPDLHEIIKLYKFYLLDGKLPNDLWPISQSLSAVNFGKSIAQIAKKEKCDLIVSPAELAGYILVSYIASKNSNIPWTVVLQGLPLAGNLDEESMHKGAWSAFLNSPRLKPKKIKVFPLIQMMLILKLLQKIVTLSASKSIVYELKLFNRKMKTIYINPPCGFDFELLKNIKPSVRSFDALFFARLIPSKGLFDIPLIWKSVTNKDPNLVLGVIGPTEKRKFLDKFFELVAKHRLEKNTVYVGPLSWQDVMSYLKASKVVVYPSSQDSFSMVVLESLVCGLPVVAYRINALKTHYGHVPAVKLLPKNFDKMADQLLLLIKNDDLRLKLRENAKSFAKQYSWDNVVKAELEAYRKVITNSS